MKEFWKKTIRALIVLAAAAVLLLLAAFSGVSGGGSTAGQGTAAGSGGTSTGSEAEAGSVDLVLSELKKDLTGDGKAETIRAGIRGLTQEEASLPIPELLHRGGEAVVTVLDGAAAAETPVCLKEYSFSTTHAGNGNLALTEYQGKPCLLLYDNTVYTGVGTFWYTLQEILPEGGSRTVEEDSVDEYRIDFGPDLAPKGISDLMPDFQDRVKAPGLERVCRKLDELLKNATILAAFSSVRDNAYLYTPEEPFTHTGLELLSVWTEGPTPASVRDYVRSRQQEAEDNWLYQKAEMDEGWSQAYAALDSVWDNVKLLELLKYEGPQDDGTETKPAGDETGAYRRVTDPRFPSVDSMENLITATYTGIAAGEWREALLENGLYREQDGVLYRKTADYVALSLPTKNILAYARVSEDEWFVTVESGKDMLGQPTRTSISLLRERDGWRISDVEPIVDCNGFACS